MQVAYSSWTGDRWSCTLNASIILLFSCPCKLITSVGTGNPSLIAWIHRTNSDLGFAGWYPWRNSGRPFPAPGRWVSYIELTLTPGHAGGVPQRKPRLSDKRVILALMLPRVMQVYRNFAKKLDRCGWAHALALEREEHVIPFQNQLNPFRIPTAFG